MQDDFTYSYYRKSLLKLKDTHKFSFFDNYSHDDIILRHDVDISLNSALEMAELESEIGIYSTYFILFHSPFYNPFSPTSSRMIRKILEMGHKIGLHYDSSYILENNLDANVTIKQELKLFSQHFNEKINLFSAHNPTTNKKIILRLGNEFLDADEHKLKINRKYISDSVQNWREGSFLKFANQSQLYVLIHPIWWTKNGESREEILQSLVGGDLDQYKKEIQSLKKYQDEYLKMINKTNNELQTT